MCGRTCLSLNEDQIRCACSYKPNGAETYVKPEWVQEHNDDKSYIPSYNIVPTEVTPVLVSASKWRQSEHLERILKPMMWGIIPPWHKDEKYLAHRLSTNNCRLENLRTSTLYNPILRNGGRCVIIAEGFYEWQTTNNMSKIKQPYYIYAPQKDNVKIDDRNTWTQKFTEDEGWCGINLLYMAGIYNVWNHNEVIIYSYSIITMGSNNDFNWLHHRMPAILDTQEKIEAWLDIDKVDPDMALAYLKPVQVLSWHKVSKDVNSSRIKTYNCNKRLSEDKKKTQSSLTLWLAGKEKRKKPDDDQNNRKRRHMEGR